MVSELNCVWKKIDSESTIFFLFSATLAGKPFILYPIVDYIESHREILTLTSPLDSEFYRVRVQICV